MQILKMQDNQWQRILLFPCSGWLMAFFHFGLYNPEELYIVEHGKKRTEKRNFEHTKMLTCK